jgi:basic amino acid/polyamine antiporter, APA family
VDPSGAQLSSSASLWHKPQLVRSMGRMTLTALALNSMLGNGVFGLLSLISSKLGAASIWAVLAAALINGIFLACFSELASRFSEAGGPYLYARVALGRFTGIQVGWFLWLTRLSAAAASANLFVAYLAEFWTPVGSRGVRIAVLTLFLAFLASVNIIGVGAGAKLSNVFTAAKLVPLTIFIVAGLIYVVEVHPHSSFSPVGNLTANWLDGLFLLFFAYGGFDAALIPMSEAKNPRKDAPLALFLAFAALTLIFTSVQLIVVRVLNDPTATDRPLATAAHQFLGTGGAALMVVGAMISVYGHLTAYALHTPRLTFALAQGGDFPAFFGKVSARFRTPYASILMFALAVWALAVTGSYRLNAVLSVGSRLIVYGAACLAVMVLRRSKPDGAWFSVPGKDLIPVAGIVLCLLFFTRVGSWDLYLIVIVALIGITNWIVVRRTLQGIAI